MYAVLFSFAMKYWSHIDVPMVNNRSAGNQTEHVVVLKSMDGPPARAGENGEPVHLHGDEELPKLKLIKKQMFNVYVSNKISYSRSIPDNRDPRCAKIKYDADLPKASVIIPFHNEEWSTLMRTLWTIVKRSPAHLLREILLVDDLSDKEELHEKLDHYVTSHFRNVRVIHSKWHRGIAGARNVGAEAATGDVLVFLESHCEAGHQWLKPLLQRVKDEPNDIAVPCIDPIDYNTLGYRQHGPESLDNFTWREHLPWRPDLVYKQDSHRAHVENYKLSPSDSEGVFAISRKRFHEIHGEDNDNLELSFRLWVCGGTIEFIPCSRMGYIFRKSQSHLFAKKDTETESLRLAERWIADFKRLIYNHDEYSKSLKDIRLGEIYTRKTLKQKLHCEYFHWYLDKIFPQESLLEETVEKRGKFVNKASHNCIDTLMRDSRKHEPLGFYGCQSNSEMQVFTISTNGEIRFGRDFCFDVFGKNDTTVRLAECKFDKGSQAWSFNQDGTIVHSSTKKCLNDNSHGHLDIKTCNRTKSQEWDFQSVA